MTLHHHSLIAWQRADDLLVRVYEITRKCFPRDERFGLTSQMRRAAYSVPANIVEGYAREHPRERLHFLQIAAGSLAEVGYCLHVARRLAFIDEALYAEEDLRIRRASAPLHGLMREYRAKTDGRVRDSHAG